MTKHHLEVNNEAKNDVSQPEEEKSPLPFRLDVTERDKNDTNIVELGMMDKKEKTDVKANQKKPFCHCPNAIIKYKNIKRYWNSILVRLIFIGIPCFHIYLVSCIYSNPVFFILYAGIIVIFLDGIYVLVKRHGHDHYWFSITFAAYIFMMIFVIVYETNYKYEDNDVACVTNATQLKYIKSCGESESKMSICSLVDVMVVGFLATLVAGRWIMPPSKRMDKEAIYYQVYSFTTLSADVIEIAQYMQNENVAEHYSLLKACQAVFGMSLLQFCFSLAAVKQRNMKLTGFRRGLDIFFSTEAWSEALSLLSQELPCFVYRIILIKSIIPSDYILSFFVLKNGLMTCLLIKRIISLCWRQCSGESKVQPLKD